jgi:hypothetical protein
VASPRFKGILTSGALSAVSNRSDAETTVLILKDAPNAPPIKYVPSRDESRDWSVFLTVTLLTEMFGLVMTFSNSKMAFYGARDAMDRRLYFYVF